MDIFALITILGVVQGVFFALLFFTQKKGNIKANRFLGMLYLSFAISIIHFIFTHLELYQRFPHIMGVALPITLLFGPLFYFYIATLVNNKYEFKKSDILHYVPFVMVVLVNLPFYIDSTEAKLEVLHQFGCMREVFFNKIATIVQLIQFFVYLIVIVKIVNKHNESIKNRMSDIEKISLSWVRTIVYALFALHIILALFLVMNFMGYDFMELFSQFFPLLVSFCIYSVGFMALRQPVIELGNSNITVNNSKKYEKSTLTKEKADMISDSLIELMNIEKIYTNNPITLQTLAEKLEISGHHLSQVINEKFEKNFFDFINYYRIEEAKSLLLSPQKQNFTILSIANEVGFNSKSAFNTAFKKHTNKTPTQFKDSTQK